MFRWLIIIYSKPVEWVETNITSLEETDWEKSKDWCDQHTSIENFVHDVSEVFEFIFFFSAWAIAPAVHSQVSRAGESRWGGSIIVQLASVSTGIFNFKILCWVHLKSIIWCWRAEPSILNFNFPDDTGRVRGDQNWIGKLVRVELVSCGGRGWVFVETEISYWVWKRVSLISSWCAFIWNHLLIVSLNCEI